MAAPIGYERISIEKLLPDGGRADGKIVWPLVIGERATFFDGQVQLFFHGVSTPRSPRTVEERRECVAVFGSTPRGSPPAMTELSGCEFAVHVRVATEEEARSAFVEPASARTVELLKFAVAVGSAPIIRFVPTGLTATYALVL